MKAIKLLYNLKYQSLKTKFYAEYQAYSNQILISYLGNYGEYEDICKSFETRDETIEISKIDKNPYVEIRSYLGNPDTTKKGRIKIRHYFQSERKNLIGLIFVSRSPLLFAIIKTGKRILQLKNKKLKIDICKNMETAQKIAQKLLNISNRSFSESFLTESGIDFTKDTALITKPEWQISLQNYSAKYSFLEPDILIRKSKGFIDLKAVNEAIKLEKVIRDIYRLRNYYLIVDYHEVTGSSYEARKKTIDFIKQTEKSNTINSIFIIGMKIIKHKVILKMINYLSLFKEKRYFLVDNLEEALDKIDKLRKGKKISSLKKDNNKITVSYKDIRNIYRYIQNTSWFNDDFKNLPTSDNEEINNIFEALMLLKNDINNQVKKLEQTQEVIMKQEKLASLGTAVAGIAHEINNPVQTIKLSIDGLEYNIKDILLLLSKVKEITRNENQEQRKELIEDLKKTIKILNIDEITEELNWTIKDNRKSIERLENIINSTKRMSYNSENFHPCNLNTIIQDSINLSSNLKYHLKVKTDLASNLPLINGLSQELGQVFINLLSNSKDAIIEKGLNVKNGEIFISSGLNNKDEIEIIFQDNGAGLKDEIINNIFDPFFTTKKVGTGLGLGLHLINKIINAHNGSILIDKDYKNGAKFIMLFPIKNNNK